MFKLVIADDEGKTTAVPLVRDEITIGRKEGNTIRLTDRNVSRRHARLQKQNGHYLLHDLGSYNGIVINGSRLVDAQPLKNGDQILIGDYKLAISEEAAAQASAPAATSNAHESADVTMPALPVATSIPAAKPGQTMTMGTPFQPGQQPTPSGVPPAPMQMAGVPGSSEAIPEEIRQMRLVFLAPPGAPPSVSLDRLPMILGRSEAADIALPYSSMSREHARLSLQGGSLVIEDLGSSNGVVVNGNKAPRSVLSPGDLVTLGVVEFRVARRGDATVVLHREPFAEPKKRSIVPIVGGVLGVSVAIAAVLFVMRPGAGSTAAAPTASAPELSAGNPPPSTALPPPAVAHVEPVVAPASPETAPSAPPTPVVVAAAVPTQDSNPPVANSDEHPATANSPEHSAHTSEHRHGSDHASNSAGTGTHNAQPATTSDTHTSTQTAAPAPAATNNTAPAPSSNTTSPSSNNSGNSSGNSGSSSGGGDPLGQARACRGDNQCVVSALQGHAQTEPELAMLAVTFRLMGNRASAVRTMNTYLRRFPSGPRSEGFRSYVENQ